MRGRRTVPAAVVLVVGMLTACSSPSTPSLSASSESSVPTAATTSEPVATPVTGSFAPTPATAPASYVELGEFGRWAQTIDELYGLQPDFTDWNDVADADCDLQRTGDTQGYYAPDSLTGVAADDVVDEGGDATHPVSGRIWAAAVLVRCPDLLDPSSADTLPEDKVAGLRWVDPDWQDRLAS